MHRVGRAPICTATQAARLYSTQPPPKPRTPLKKWGDLVIPSRQEVINLRTKRTNTDINYLKFENEKSLAARLARPTIDITLAREQAQTQTPEQTDAATAEALSEEAETSDYIPGSLPASATIERMINQRREARLEREREHLAQKQRAEAERAQYEELRILRAAHRKEVEEEKRAKIHASLNDFRPLTEESNMARTVDSEVDVRRAQLAKLAADLAAKRRLEREAREKELALSGLVRREKKPSQSLSHRMATSDAKRKEEEEFQIQLNEEGVIGSFEPQFQDPEPPINGTTLAKIFQVSTVKANTIRGGDYSSYITPSAEAFSTSPDELGAVSLAGVALSHRRDVSLPQRHQSLELISKALARKTASKPQVEP
ncbi:hypothetical protein BDN70DRAFT_870006 [Pholiota conissans]|uniref:Uncharacterized protein n=1 Tax=Pholiota conissans TaxID=109636 RepID=A0A9P5ZFF3_9AGAR|nr:hypothetical protein BDN70DRAFT_870006 [Pholiota conissans]